MWPFRLVIKLINLPRERAELMAYLRSLDPDLPGGLTMLASVRHVMDPIAAALVETVDAVGVAQGSVDNALLDAHLDRVITGPGSPQAPPPA